MVTFDNLYELIVKNKTIAIFSHMSPDGDTVGSALALFMALKKAGKTVHYFCDGFFDNKLSSLPCAEKVNPEPLSKYDLSIAIDSSDYERLGRMGSVFDKGKYKMVIDHHKSHINYGNMDYLDIRASTGEIIFEFLDKFLNQYIDEKIAECIYVAILTDSGAFAYENISKKTFEVMCKLYDYNVDYNAVYYKHMKSQTLPSFLLKKRAYSGIMFLCNNKIAVVKYTQKDFAETGADIFGTSTILADIISIEDVQIALSFTEVHDKTYKISIRTKKPIDASEIAREFGGGGHVCAAGLSLNGYYENILDDVLKVCKDNL